MRNDKNLLKLADYLDKLPDDYVHFDMSDFFNDGESCPFPEGANIKNICGTVACAVGHGPAAGIEALKGEGWFGYSSRVFTGDIYEWRWCFCDDWQHVDNTPKGAALRIRHLIDVGLPLDSYEQKRGTAPYLFAEETA